MRTARRPCDGETGLKSSPTGVGGVFVRGAGRPREGLGRCVAPGICGTSRPGIGISFPVGRSYPPSPDYGAGSG
jgi:hypothetical protein